MSEARDLLRLTAELAADYVETLGERPVFPNVTPEELRLALGGPLPDGPICLGCSTDGGRQSVETCWFIL